MTSSEDYGRLTDYRYEFVPDARRFEVVTLAYQDFAIANAALGAMADAGGPAGMASALEALTTPLVRWAEARDDVRLVTPSDPSRRAGIVSFVPADLDATVARLQAAGVVFVAREGMVRLSPHGYNTGGEVERVLAVLDG